MDKLKINLTPYQAMQICRYESYLLLAINDPMQTGCKYDREGVSIALKELCKQVRKKITNEQIEDAAVERDVNKLIKGETDK